MIKRIFIFVLCAASLLSIIPQTQAAVPIQSAIGGAWYKPSESGHGFLINVSNTDGQLTLLATWYVYDKDGNQMWLVGSAPFSEGDISVTVPVIVTRGAFFDRFNSSDVESTDWGTLTFEFSSCNKGTVDVDPFVNIAPGTVAIQRLTNTAGTQCTEPDPVPPNPDNPGGFDKGIEIISINIQPGFSSLLCDITVTAHNHNPSDLTVLIGFNILLQNTKIVEAGVNSKLGAGKTATLSNFFPSTGKKCSQLTPELNDIVIF